MRVLRVYHGGRSRAHRARERAMTDAGVDVTLVVPAAWPEGGGEPVLTPEPFDLVELPVTRAGDVNRHSYADPQAVADLVRRTRPDLLDLHEEPFSAVVHQLLAVVPPTLPVVTYTAQNLDKRYPPPFTAWERASFSRASGIYPCSRQAASVVRGRGYGGQITVLPLGVDPGGFRPGDQRHDDDVLTIALVGRMVAEKGVADALRVVAEVSRHRPTRLLLAGSGPELDRLPELAQQAGGDAVLDLVKVRPWVDQEQLAGLYRTAHLVLVPSRATSRWVEQFGRTVVEAQACGAVVLAYASGTIPEVAAGGAWLSAEGDVLGLSRAAVRFATSAELWLDWRTRGLEAARDKTWPAVIGRQLGLYERAVRQGSTPVRRASTVTRQEARAEFGPTAETGDRQRRPFALPVLRGLPVASRVADVLQRRASTWR